MSSPFSPKSQVSKINCHVLFIDLSHDLGPARFPSRAPPHRGDGGDRQPLWQDGGQGSTSSAGRLVVPAPATAQGCPTALETPRLLPSCPLPTLHGHFPGCASAHFNLSPATSHARVCSASFQVLLLS